jgi:hypothetical protein
MATHTQDSERFQRGWQRLMEVDAEGGERVIESLKDVAPDLGRMVVEFAFGEIYQRPRSTCGNGSSSRSQRSRRWAVPSRSWRSISTLR